jgi:hypothetical protein
MTARKEKTWVPRVLALALSLLFLGVASGDIGHAIASGTWHGFETTIATAADGPTDPNTPDPISSQVATQCPFCSVGRSSTTALSQSITYFAVAGERSHAVFLPETSVPSSPHGRANAARAPPTRLSA